MANADDQKELFEILFAIGLNAVFLALIALLFWPLGQLAVTFRLTKGYVILWAVILGTFVLISRLHRFFRVDIYTHANAFVISNLVLSCLLQAGWSAFAALTIQGFVVSSPAWILYIVGVISCLVAFYAVSSFYQGHVYKFVSRPLALIAFIVFSVWPASGRVIYGWSFDFFENAAS
ncbi:MAG: hypothetical protein ABR568_02650 [Pyrinomonadaceae bacterium]